MAHLLSIISEFNSIIIIVFQDVNFDISVWYLQLYLGCAKLLLNYRLDSEGKIKIWVDRVELEKGFGGIVPDIIIWSGNRKLIIEIHVTHAIDETKLHKIRSLNLSTLEVNLSNRDTMISQVELEDLLIGNSPEKYWIYNSVAEQWKQRFLASADVFYATARGRVNYCPVKKRIWKGKSYADFMNDCFDCSFLIDASQQYGPERNTRLFCTGKKRIFTLEDFSLTLNERIEKYDNMETARKSALIEANKCPKCENTLVTRKGKFGTFMGCSNYPDCKFTLSVDSETGEILV